ncbi:hypothetical protein HK100_008131, partial [Physocladia obscura]
LFLDFSVVDYPGQCDFYDPAAADRAAKVFANAVSVIFVVDAQDDTSVSMQQLLLTVRAANKVKKDILFEVFIHKIDGLSDDHKIETQRDVQHRVREDLADAGLEKVHIGFHLTSIYDHSVYEAFSKVVQRILGEEGFLPTLENLMNIWCSNSGLEKAFLFDTATKIYIATDSSPFDGQSHEICADMLDLVFDISGVYGVIPNHNDNSSSSSSSSTVTAAEPSSEMSSVVRLTNGMVLYMRALTNALSLVCLLREENFEKRGLIDFNFERNSLENIGDESVAYVLGGTRMQQTIQPIFRRLPGLLALLLIPFAMFGPRSTPIAFAAYYCFLNIALCFTTARTAAGIACAWILAVKHSKTDWSAVATTAAGRSVETVVAGNEIDGTTIGDSHSLRVADVVHVIVVPNYKEELANLRDTLDVLASHCRALSNYVICLAMEESEAESLEKAILLKAEYSMKFHKFEYSVHPTNLQGEMRGKSSNVNFAARHLFHITSPTEVFRHIFTIIDADTTLTADYFESIASKYTGDSISRRGCGGNSEAQIFVPFSIFDRNASSVGATIRMIDAAWSAAHLSYFLYRYPFAPALSVYSVPMRLVEKAGFWDTGADAMAEDMHMTLKLTFATKGLLRVTHVYSPASQCDVVGRRESWWSYNLARAVQLKRHSWGGTLEFSYFLWRVVENVFGGVVFGERVGVVDDDFLYGDCGSD